MNVKTKIKDMLRLTTKNSIKRSKTVVGLVNTVIGGYRAATKIDAWREPPREILPKYIQAFCRKAANAVGVKIIEVEPIPKTHALWASNHISWMDIPVIGSLSPAFFLSKAEVAEMPIMGPLAKVSGSLFIKRGSGDAGSVASQMANFLKLGYSIVFFPEATTTDGRHIKKLHGKLLQASIDANKPIQPLVLCYVNKEGKLDDKVPYYGGIKLKDSLMNVIDGDLVTAYVLPLQPLYPKDKTRDQLTEELQQVMQAGLEELHSRVLKK
ncbi:lysophospholipid acyltransferase family protein [Psychrobacter sp.]|uniref:lysophospholipid acyltransferase family protein n=1 Tax=Psychrobacter sp. TaxID=56811 RepID=UPI0025E0E6F2|nr:lysophospholipid acyltransferase family protein [Psychrobacter sp.]